MRHRMLWLVLILVAVGLPILWCMAPRAEKRPKKIVPATVAKIDGTELNRLTLLPEAARRLDIQTALVREGPIRPKLKVSGEVISVSGGLKAAIVRAETSGSDVKKVLRDEPAYILPLSSGGKPFRVKAMPVKDPARLGLGGPPGTLYYETGGASHGLVSRQLVFLELSLEGSGEERRILPYSAVLYDPSGNTWVYTNPERLVFVREQIRIESMAGDDVILADGPDAGAAVVTVGAAELYGTEFGVGK